ncbi:MAG: response regulator transcription factor [Lachnospira sp.]
MDIIIVDDDQLVSLSLKTILEAENDINVDALGQSGSDAITLFDKHRPDVLLMDIRMEHLNGLEAAEAIIAKYPDAKILLLTTFSDDEYIIKAIHLGAKGYILKQAFETIAPAIRAVYNGQTVFGDEIMNKIPSLIQKQDSFDYDSFDLSDKEFEIIKLVSEGLNNKEIAAAVYLSEGTVRNYISTILEKLKLRDRTQLACFYYKNNLFCHF